MAFYSSWHRSCGKDRGAHFGLGVLKSNREPDGVWGETPRKIFCSHALYFGDQRLFPMANAPWKRQLSSAYPITKSPLKASFIEMYCITFYFHSKKTQPRMKELKLKRLSQSRGIISEK